MLHKNTESENWNNQKTILIQKLSVLIKNELSIESGTREEWLEKLQNKFGKTREELLKLLSNIENQ